MLFAQISLYIIYMQNKNVLHKNDVYHKHERQTKGDQL